MDRSGLSVHVWGAHQQRSQLRQRRMGQNVAKVVGGPLRLWVDVQCAQNRNGAQRVDGQLAGGVDAHGDGRVAQQRQRVGFNFSVS